MSGRKGAGDVVTAVAPTPGQPVPTTPMDAGEFTNSLPSRRSTGSPTQPGSNSGTPGPISSPRRARSRLSVKSFPPDLGISSTHAHYMMFSLFKIKGTVGSSSDNSFTDAGQSVALPIPGSPAVSYEQGWETEQMGAVMSGLVSGGQAAVDAYMGGPGSEGGLWEATKAITKQVGTASKNSIKGAGVMGTVGRMIGNKAIGQSMGRAVFDESFAVYGGPAYRTFAFNFSLMPLSEDDTIQIKAIVDFFKTNSAPKALAPGLVRIYELPHAFGITYHNKGGENQYMNKIGKCVLTNMGVTYGGEKFNTFDGIDAPVQVDITLSFKELQLQDSSSMADGY